MVAVPLILAVLWFSIADSVFGSGWPVAVAGGRWELARGGPGPGFRRGHAMVYDRARDEIVLYGGHYKLTEGRTQFLADTWVYDGRGWTERSPSVSPGVRTSYALAYDATLGVVLLFGGRDQQGTRYQDTWAWDGSNWKQVAELGPSPRLDAAMVSHEGVILFGGTTDASHVVPAESDTWRWRGGEWQRNQ